MRLGESRWAVGGEDLLGADLGDAVGQGEGQVLGEQLLDVRALDIVGLLELDDAEDLEYDCQYHSVLFCHWRGSAALRSVTYVDGPEAGTVAGSHVLVHGLDGLGAGHLAVLLVHVVGTGAGVVADPDAEVLDLEGVLLVDLQ